MSVPVVIPLCREAADGLVVSSLESTAVKLGTASTKHRTPNLKSLRSGDPLKAKTVGHRKPVKRLKRQCQRGEKKITKFQEIVEEYINKEKAKATAFKRNRSTTPNRNTSEAK